MREKQVEDQDGCDDFAIRLSRTQMVHISHSIASIPIPRSGTEKIDEWVYKFCDFQLGCSVAEAKQFCSPCNSSLPSMLPVCLLNFPVTRLLLIDFLVLQNTLSVSEGPGHLQLG